MFLFGSKMYNRLLSKCPYLLEVNGAPFSTHVSNNCKPFIIQKCRGPFLIVISDEDTSFDVEILNMNSRTVTNTYVCCCSLATSITLDIVLISQKQMQLKVRQQKNNNITTCIHCANNLFLYLEEWMFGRYNNNLCCYAFNTIFLY